MEPQPALRADDVTALHDRLLAAPGWPPRASRAPHAPHVPHVPHAPDDPASAWTWIEANHRHNALLWAEEDLARRRSVPDAEIAANKRAIDGFNQARNDAVERLDELLLVALGLVDADAARGDAPRTRAAAGSRLSSETAGSMVDRLSILSLKIRAMREQAGRGDVDDAHRASGRARLARLVEQREDLAGCLDALLSDAAAGRAHFKVYRQFKMYNDPRLNPALVREAAGRGGAGGG